MKLRPALYRLVPIALSEAKCKASQLLNSCLYLSRCITVTMSFFALFLPSHGIAADAAVEVDVRATAEVREQVAAQDGTVQWRFRPAGQLNQGEEVFFTLSVRNGSPVVAPDVTVTWPVPANTIYVPHSASGPAAQVDYSVDGGRTFGRGAQLRVADGTGGMRPATERDYTHVRWRLRYPLAPSAVALLRFRAVFQ